LVISAGSHFRMSLLLLLLLLIFCCRPANFSGDPSRFSWVPQRSVKEEPLGTVVRDVHARCPSCHQPIVSKQQRDIQFILGNMAYIKQKNEQKHTSNAQYKTQKHPITMFTLYLDKTVPNLASSSFDRMT